jgi:hypothetical protein
MPVRIFFFVPLFCLLLIVALSALTMTDGTASLILLRILTDVVNFPVVVIRVWMFPCKHMCCQRGAEHTTITTCLSCNPHRFAW